MAAPTAPTAPDTEGVEATPSNVAPDTSQPAAPSDSTDSGSGGFFGWVDHAAKAVGNVVGKVASSVPGVSAVTGALNRVYTDVISHPIATALHVANMANFSGSALDRITAPFKASNWSTAWDQTNHISPGQEVVLGWNNNLSDWEGKSKNEISPADPQAVADLFQRNSVASLTSGGLDLALRTYADPSSIAAKALGAKVADIKNQPVKAASNSDQVIASKGTQRLIGQVTQAFDKPNTFSTIQNLKAVKNSPMSYTLASALHAAGGDAAKTTEIIRVAVNDPAALDRLAADQSTLEQGASTVATNVANSGKVPLSTSAVGDSRVAKLVQQPQVSGQLAAMRLSAMLSPADLSLKSALSDMDPQAFDEWFQTPAKLKADHAQQAFQTALQDNQMYRDLAGSMMGRTTGDLPGLTSAAGRAARKLATPSAGAGRLGGGNLFHDTVQAPTHFAQIIHSHVADPIIRIYHTFSDQRPTNTVEFGTQQAVQQVRSLLNTSTVISAEEKDGMLADFAKANAGGKAAAQAGFNKLEQDLHSKTATHFGLDPEHGDTIYHEFAARRDIAIKGVTSRAYGTIDGNAVFPTHDYNEVVADPFMETQLAGGAMPMSDMRDYEQALKRMQDSGLTAHVHALKDKGHTTLVSGLDKIYGLWKPLTMLTGHRSFNHTGDDALRSMVKVGATATIRNFSKGTANFLYNRSLRLTKGMIAHNLEGQWDKEVGDLRASYEGTRARYLDQQQRIAAGEKIHPDNMVQAPEVSAAKQALDSKVAAGPPVPKKLRLGEGTFKVPGTNVEYPEIYGGSDGAYIRVITSADKTFTFMFDKSAVNDFNSQGALADHDVITARDGVKVHGAALLRHINNQITNDPVARMMYQGKTDTEISNWMRGSAAGIRRMNALHIGNPMDNITHVRDAVNRYLPTPWIKDKAFTSKLNNGDLERLWPNASARPDVIGNLAVLPHSGTPATGYIRAASNRIIKLTGSLPDDILVRHPLANDLYKTNMSRLVQQSLHNGTEVQVGSDLYHSLHNQAMNSTRSTMQKTLYDSSRFVDASHTLRFISPFFSAWHNAMQSWSSLIASNPQLIVRGLEAKHALWNAPFAVDSSTGQKATDKTGLDSLAFIMHMPHGLAKSLGLGDMNDINISASKVVSPTYADSVGNPGFGPLVQAPVNQLVKENPSLITNPFVAQILGGRITKNSLQSFIPSAASQVLDSLGMSGITGDPEDVASRAKLKWTLYQEQYSDYMAGKRSSPPNWNDISSQASWLDGIIGVVNRLMPLGYVPQDQYKFLTDAYQQMYAEDPQNADQNFYDKYGTTGWIYTQSLGKNVAGIAPSQGAIEAYKKNSGLVSKFPELGAVIVGAKGTGGFDDMAYQWEVANGLRTKLSPEDAAKQAQTNLGWVQFDKINANIQAQLQQRGLTDVNQKGAEDLKAAKSTYVSATGDPTSQYYNPDFYGSYGSFNANAYETRLQSLQTLSMDQSLLANPARADIKSLNQYFQYRDAIYNALQIRGAAPKGSASMSAKSNADLQDWLTYYVGQLQSADTTFQPIYERFLAKDDFKQPL